MSEDLLSEESTPIWFNVRKPVEFDESTSRIRLLQNAPSTQNTISSLNAAQEIRFEYVPATDQVILLSDPNSCFRLRCTFYTANTTNGSFSRCITTYYKFKSTC